MFSGDKDHVREEDGDIKGEVVAGIAKDMNLGGEKSNLCVVAHLFQTLFC